MNEGFAQGRSLVVDTDWDLNGHSSFLAHTFDTIHLPRETQRTVHRKLAKRPERPLVRAARDDLANDGLLRVAERAAKRNFYLTARSLLERRRSP
ncbi:MAG TPA: hypothetical protein VGM27_21080 [Acidobacteriaceae bacterium]